MLVEIEGFNNRTEVAYIIPLGVEITLHRKATRNNQAFAFLAFFNKFSRLLWLLQDIHNDTKVKTR